jgi:hypothetical protein
MVGLSDFTLWSTNTEFQFEKISEREGSTWDHMQVGKF